MLQDSADDTQTLSASKVTIDGAQCRLWSGKLASHTGRQRRDHQAIAIQEDRSNAMVVLWQMKITGQTSALP